MTAMEITITQTDGMMMLGILGDLRIATVADAKAQLVPVVAAWEEIQVDLSGVGQCDTAGIQLLLMVCASARAKGKRLATSGHTNSLRLTLDRIGISVENLGSHTAVPEDGHDGRDRGSRG
jgi:anti-sigma B factor antagonist